VSCARHLFRGCQSGVAHLEGGLSGIAVVDHS
jgi:hypothetical protein